MREQKLIIIQGIPGSGKSYKARKLYKKAKHNTVIVNRDDIRAMLGDYWVPTREHLVTALEEDMITKGLNNGYDVIIDATNLNPKSIEKFKKIAESECVKLEFIQLTTSPLMAYIKILWRALLGGRYISYKVIKGFYNRYFK